MINFYGEKYPHQTDFMMMKSLTYFDDADNYPEPQMFKDFNWESCKQKIREEFNKLEL